MMQMIDAFFPPSPRVLYAKSPLAEVICQLRFPTVLRIEGEPPAEFQDKIRGMFPLFERNTAAPLPQIPQELSQLFANRPSSVVYSFSTEDKRVSLSLTADAIALTSTDYRKWEDFRGCLQKPVRALIETYKPSFFTRIGLRYTDIIDRSKLGLTARKWSELLCPTILGELVVPAFEDNIEVAQRAVRVRFPDDTGSLLLLHGLAEVQGQAETYYRLDFDFFTDQRTEVERAESILDAFNSRAGRAFRWCITETLHRALEPTGLPL